MNYVVVAVPYFILAMLVEFLYGKLVKRQTYRLADTVNSLQLGTLSRLVDVLRLGFSAIVFGALVKLLGVPQWSMDSPWQWVAAWPACTPQRQRKSKLVGILGTLLTLGLAGVAGFIWAQSPLSR